MRKLLVTCVLCLAAGLLANCSDDDGGRPAGGRDMSAAPPDMAITVPRPAACLDRPDEALARPSDTLPCTLIPPGI